MTAIITNLTIPTGVTVSGQTISGSLLFTGSYQHLVTSANNVFATGTNDFTVEGWAWIDPACNSLAGLVTNASNSQGGFLVAVDTTGVLAPAGSGANVVGWLAALPYSTWFHFALTMQSNTIRLFKDGVLQGSTARTSYTSTGTIAAIGSRYADSTAWTFKGYMSNVRIIAGIALYTSAFTVPSGPLSVTQYSNQNGSPSAAINTLGSTALLMNTINNASYLNDSSNYDLTVSAYSGPAPTSSALNPF